jgi:hypothetical protein
MPDEPVDQEKLFALVAGATPFSREQFERLLDHRFGETAPRSVKLLARDLIGLPSEAARLLKLVQLGFPDAKITYIGEVQPLPGQDGP